MIFWQEGFSFDSTCDILNKDGSLRTWEKNLCTGRGSCSSKFMDAEFGLLWHLAMFHSPNVPISPQDILSRNLFIRFFPLLFNVPLSPATFSRDSWFQWTLWKSADYPQQKRLALVLDPAAWCFVSSCPLFPIKRTHLLSSDIVITIKVTTTTNTKGKSFAKGAAFLLVS